MRGQLQAMEHGHWKHDTVITSLGVDSNTNTGTDTPFRGIGATQVTEIIPEQYLGRLKVEPSEVTFYCSYHYHQIQVCHVLPFPSHIPETETRAKISLQFTHWRNATMENNPLKSLELNFLIPCLQHIARFFYFCQQEPNSILQNLQKPLQDISFTRINWNAKL